MVVNTAAMMSAVMLMAVTMRSMVTGLSPLKVLMALASCLGCRVALAGR
jgi:hypothetical protein